MSKLIFNFSHPLTGHALEGIREEVGESVVSLVRVQLDLNAPVGEQVFKLCRRALELYGKPDYVIPPGHALAAVYVDRFFSGVEGFPPVMSYTPIIRLVMIANSTPPAFAFGGIE